MKKLLTLLAATFLTLVSTSLLAQNYYVCDTGDDSNNGLSESSPFQSFGKAIGKFNTMNGGDSVLFCRGGVFATVDNRLFNTKCSATAMCTLADYGDVNKERPQLIADDLYLLRFEDGGNADADGGYTVRNLILMSSTNSQIGIFLYNDVDDVVLDNLHIQGFRVGVSLAGANTQNEGSNGANDRVILKNSVIVNNGDQGLLGGCNDCLIENNIFENNGFNQAVFNHNIYLSSPAGRSSGMTVRANTLYKSAIVNGKCSGVSLVVHGTINDLVIDSNVIKEDKGNVSEHCWGISVDPGYSGYDEAFTNVVIQNNKLLNVGNIGIGCASCDGVTIENNVIIDEGSALSVGIAVPVRAEDSVKSNNVKILNNEIIISQLSGVGIRVGGQNPALVQANTISRPVNTTSKCIDRRDASEQIDISSNTCKNHTSLSVIDTAIEQPATEVATTEVATTEVATTEVATTEVATTEVATTEVATTEVATTEVATTERTTSTKDSKRELKLVSLGAYKSSKGRQGSVGFIIKCRAETADGRCLFQ